MVQVMEAVELPTMHSLMQKRAADLKERIKSDAELFEFIQGENAKRRAELQCIEAFLAIGGGSGD